MAALSRAWDFDVGEEVVVLATGRKGRVSGQSRFKFPAGIYLVEHADDRGLPEHRWYGPTELRTEVLN